MGQHRLGRGKAELDLLRPTRPLNGLGRPVSVGHFRDLQAPSFLVLSVISWRAVVRPEACPHGDTKAGLPPRPQGRPAVWDQHKLPGAARRSSSTSKDHGSTGRSLPTKGKTRSPWLCAPKLHAAYRAKSPIEGDGLPRSSLPRCRLVRSRRSSDSAKSLKQWTDSSSTVPQPERQVIRPPQLFCLGGDSKRVRRIPEPSCQEFRSGERDRGPGSCGNTRFPMTRRRRGS